MGVDGLRPGSSGLRAEVAPIRVASVRGPDRKMLSGENSPFHEEPLYGPETGFGEITLRAALDKDHTSSKRILSVNTAPLQGTYPVGSKNSNGLK